MAVLVAVRLHKEQDDSGEHQQDVGDFPEMAERGEFPQNWDRIRSMTESAKI